MCQKLIFALCFLLQFMGNFAENSQKDVFTILSNCGFKDGLDGLANCASMKLLKNLERLNQIETIQLGPGITLTGGQNDTSRLGKSLQELPEDPAEKSTTLLNLLLETFSKFFASRTLKIKLPSSNPETLSRALEEGRGKIKKLMSPLMGIGVKVISTMAILLAGLAALTVKALSVGSFALIVSIILFIQVYFSGSRTLFSPFGGGYNSYGYGTYGTGYGYPAGGTNQIGGGWNPQFPYKRSFDVGENRNEPQELAYSAQNNQ